MSCPSSWTSLMAQMVKNLPAVQETQVQSLALEDPLEKGMATHSSILAWRIPIDRGAWWVTVHGITKDWTRLSNFTHKELYKKDLHNPDNNDGVINHLEPDILECEVQWALGSITRNKASGGDGIPLS